jgi:hypothetical protein
MASKATWLMMLGVPVAVARSDAAPLEFKVETIASGLGSVPHVATKLRADEDAHDSRGGSRAILPADADRL